MKKTEFGKRYLIAGVEENLVKVERILLTKRPLEVTALRREESYLTKENLEHLMKEHTRGCPICCLIAHDTFGSFVGMLLAYSAGKRFGGRRVLSCTLMAAGFLSYGDRVV
jgi:hypothetical protein